MRWREDERWNRVTADHTGWDECRNETPLVPWISNIAETNAEMITAIAELARKVPAQYPPLRANGFGGVTKFPRIPYRTIPMARRVGLGSVVEVVDHALLIDRQPGRVGGEQFPIIPHVQFTRVVTHPLPEACVAECRTRGIHLPADR